MIQKLPYFWNKKKVFFFLFHFELLWICYSGFPGLCQHRPGHSLGKNIKLHKMKNRKSNFGFSYIMANFEAFRWNFSSSTNPEIVRSELLKTRPFEWRSFQFSKPHEYQFTSKWWPINKTACNSQEPFKKTSHGLLIWD